MVKQLNVRRQNWLCRLYLRWGTFIFREGCRGAGLDVTLLMGAPALQKLDLSTGSPLQERKNKLDLGITAGLCPRQKLFLWGLPAMTACACRLRAVSKAQEF